MHPDRLTELYRRYGPAIYARCRTLLADESSAENATQETFLRAPADGSSCNSSLNCSYGSTLCYCAGAAWHCS